MDSGRTLRWKKGRLKNAGAENAGVEKSGAYITGGKCKSRLAVLKAEPRLSNETSLSNSLNIVHRLLSEQRASFIALLNRGCLCSRAPFTGKPLRLLYNTDVSNADLVRELVNCATAQTVSPYTPGVYTPGLFMSIVHSLKRFASAYTTGVL